MRNLLTAQTNMAAYSEDYKLPLRQWLIKQIDSQKYPGLEWEDYQVTFRLPWEKKHGAGWEEKHEIFKAWAQHRNHTSLTDPTKLKANFRSALNKSESFAELKEKNELCRQTGNYKVYKLLTPKEVEEKKRKEPQKRKSKHGSASAKNSYPVFNSLEDCKPKKEKLCTTAPNENYDIFSNVMQGAIPPGAMKVDFLNSNQPSPSLEMSPLNAQIDSVGGAWSNETFRQTNKLDFLGKNEMGLSSPGVTSEWPQMAMNISPPILPTINTNDTLKPASFRIIVYYNGQMNKEVSEDLTQGIRLHYKLPKSSQMAAILQKSEDPIWKNGDFLNLPEMELPSNETKNPTLQKILEALRLGFTLRYENNCLKIIRYCQSHIFLVNSDEGESRVPYYKIEKYQPTTVFDIGKMVQSWNQDRVYGCVYLACGIKPKNIKEIEKERGVCIKIVSEVAEVINQLSTEQKQSMSSMASSICMSTSTDVEEILKKFSSLHLQN